MNAAVPTRWHSLFDPGQFLGCVRIGFVGGIAAGVMTGVVARIVMRVVAMVSGLTPSFSIQGTLFILGLGAFLGLWVGIVFGFLLPFLPGPVTRKGLLFGMVPSLIFAVLSLIAEPEGELALAPRWITAAGLASIPLAYGLFLGQIAARLAPPNVDSRVDNRTFARTAGLITMVAALAGAILETVLAVTHPAMINLGFSTANILTQLASGCLILMSFMGIAGVMRSGAAGEGRIAKIGLGFNLVTIALLGIVSVYEGLDSIQLHGLVRLMDGISSVYSDWLLLTPLLLAVLGLLFAGVSVLREKRWTGWRAYTLSLAGAFPLLSVLFLHPSFFPAWLGPRQWSEVGMSYGLGGLFSLCWLALGIALWVENRSPALSGNQALDPITAP